jgi:hypothetical protein
MKVADPRKGTLPVLIVPRDLRLRALATFLCIAAQSQLHLLSPNRTKGCQTRNGMRYLSKSLLFCWRKKMIAGVGEEKELELRRLSASQSV